MQPVAQNEVALFREFLWNGSDNINHRSMAQNAKEENMKIFRIWWISGLILLTIMFAGFSCAHRNAGKQETATTPAEDEKRRAEYQKELQDAKKIVVARVNGVAISLYDLMNKMNQLASAYIPESHQRTPEIDQAVKQEALDILIFRELAVQEAVRQGLKIPPAALDKFIQDVREGMGSEDAYNNYLKNTDSTEESLKKEFERNQLFDMIASKEIYLQAENDEPPSIEKRKQEWESELKKNATIEILLGEVEKKLKEGSENPGKKQ